MESGAPKGVQNQSQFKTLGPSGQIFEIWGRFLESGLIFRGAQRDVRRGSSIEFARI